ncbi:MAG TPA: Ni/Fe hydrogenase subunit alpha [Bryobacteraceae bacterium]|nr:Ni/Fe hydrogenase subunit alpha [Bryobacteraceae bacterium]
MKRVSINPITRLEGHGKIDIFLDERGNVANASFQVPELRGFEQFCRGRQAEDMPAITSRICGVCPEAHHLASVKALDQLFAAEPPPAAKKIRELLYMAFFVTDHTTHFYALGGPDFIAGPDAPPSERNILGVVRRVGLAAGKAVIECRARNHRVIQMLGGRGIHPTAGLPGGWSKSVSEAERAEIEEAARRNVEFAQFSLQVFERVVWRNPVHREMVESGVYCHRTYSMGTVDAQNRLNLYDGEIRIVDPEGLEFARFPASQYLDHVAEHVEPWTYLKFPFLKKIGWKGFQDGAASGVYAATPLTRLNVSAGLSTSLAQCEFEKFYAAFGGRKPVHQRLATHWARLIEMLYAAERMLALATDPEITSPEVRAIPQRIRGTGVGSVEAPRGTLIHHYESDEKGLLRRVNLIAGTTNNHAAIAMSVRKAAECLIRAGKVVEEGVLNRIEMAFRLYDPCLSCATHALPGSMPLVVRVRNHAGETIRTLRREG